MNAFIFKASRYVIKSAAETLHSGRYVSPSLACVLENIFSWVFCKKVRFSYDPKNKLFEARENSIIRYFRNQKRGFWLYRDGIQTRGKFIFNSYRLHNVALCVDDVIIDCGANSGDLSIELFESCPGIKYVAIEPAPEDFFVLQKNLGSVTAITENIALGDSVSDMTFYLNSDTGDSSLVEPPKYFDAVKVKVVLLDDILKKYDISKVKLLKIEAEGFEPEVLQGAEQSLHRVEFIAIDGGYERGLDQQQTFTYISNFLISRNFEMVDIYFPWNRALFKNKNIAV